MTPEQKNKSILLPAILVGLALVFLGGLFLAWPDKPANNSSDGQETQPSKPVVSESTSASQDESITSNEWNAILASGLVVLAIGYYYETKNLVFSPEITQMLDDLRKSRNEFNLEEIKNELNDGGTDLSINASFANTYLDLENDAFEKWNFGKSTDSDEDEYEDEEEETTTYQRADLELINGPQQPVHSAPKKNRANKSPLKNERFLFSVLKKEFRRPYRAFRNKKSKLISLRIGYFVLASILVVGLFRSNIPSFSQTGGAFYQAFLPIIVGIIMRFIRLNLLSFKNHILWASLIIFWLVFSTFCFFPILGKTIPDYIFPFKRTFSAIALLRALWDFSNIVGLFWNWKQDFGFVVWLITLPISPLVLAISSWCY